MVKTAAKEVRLGKLIDSAIVVSPPGGRLEYDGPRTRVELWEDERYRLVKPTRRGVMCCRPIWENWEVKFSLRFLSDRINRSTLQDLITAAGKTVGLSDWPRRYGLFTVEGFEAKEEEIDVTA